MNGTINERFFFFLIERCLGTLCPLLLSSLQSLEESCLIPYSSELAKKTIKQRLEEKKAHLVVWLVLQPIDDGLLCVLVLFQPDQSACFPV